MSGVNNYYPSCIKIPATNSKQGHAAAAVPQKFEVKDALAINNGLISIANQRLGTGAWKHTVTSQTLDFVEPHRDAYHCGCVTFVKIELLNGVSHEDMGYCFAEAKTKGLSIYTARVGSVAAAFRKVLICFGEELEIEVERLVKKHQPSVTENNVTEDIQCSLSNVEVDILEPCARSTPYITRKTVEPKDIPDAPSASKSGVNPKGQTDVQQATSKLKKPNDQKDQLTVQPSVSRPKSPIEHVACHLQQADSTKLRAKSLCDLREQAALQSNCAKQQKDQDSVAAQKEGDQKNGLSEEEILRMERKRKQMEKQAEFKRLMKEKELQKSNDNKKPNPRY